MSQETQSELPRGVIGVPGKWSDHEEVVGSLIRNADEFLCVGKVLLHRESNRSFILEEYEYEPRMREAFQCAGAGRIPEKDLDQIGEHCRTLYVSGEVGSVPMARDLMLAAAALIKAGGLGVKVESSGVAHSASTWPLLCEDGQRGAMLHAMVAFVGEEGGYYSCGMHHFGLRDVIINDDIAPFEAGQLMEGFCGYQLLEEKDMLDGDTFSLAENSPRYQISKHPCEEFDPTDLFFNPYGTWRLSPHLDCERN